MYCKCLTIAAAALILLLPLFRGCIIPCAGTPFGTQPCWQMTGLHVYCKCCAIAAATLMLTLLVFCITPCRHPIRYTALLADKLQQHGSQAWLVNTGAGLLAVHGEYMDSTWGVQH